MSAEEMRNFCQSIRPFDLRVQVRLKDRSETFFGKIINVERERFELETDDKVMKSVRFAWVARIANA